MPTKHEPDPRFIQGLEWQLGRALRRNKTGAAEPRPFRKLRLAVLVLGSVALGAVVMGASQHLQDSWRKELLEARLEVQLQVARKRVEAQLDAIGPARDRVEQGMQSDRDLAYFELRIAEAEADAALVASELEELRLSGREPLGQVSSPLVDGRDFVGERIEARMEVARRRLDIAVRAGARTRQLVELGVVHERELGPQDLVALEAELQLQTLAEQLEVRRAFLDSDLSAAEAELRYLEVEARNRVALLDRRLEYFQNELQRYQATERAGLTHAAAVAELRTKLAEAEAELRLAREELRIVRDELEKRAARR